MRVFRFNEQLESSCLDEIRTILVSTGSFSSQEVDLAADLVMESLEKGASRSGYYFLMARDERGKLAGFTCFGPVPCTLYSYDLYWIAVRGDCRGMGLGRQLYLKTEDLVKQSRGRRIYVETSGRADYHPARHFYQKLGFKEVCRLGDFYAPGDDKVIYEKKI